MSRLRVDYMAQTNLTILRRKQLIKCLDEIREDLILDGFPVKLESVGLALEIFDRTLEHMTVLFFVFLIFKKELKTQVPKNMALFALTCFWIATKYLDSTLVFTAADLEALADMRIPKMHFVWMERNILENFFGHHQHLHVCINQKIIFFYIFHFFTGPHLLDTVERTISSTRFALGINRETV